MEDNDITEQIIGCAMKVHKKLGPGLLESAYIACLTYELIELGLFVEREKPLPLMYDGVKLDCGYRLDLLVENKIIVEAKCVSSLNEIHTAQLITYVKLSKCPLWLNKKA